MKRTLLLGLFISPALVGCRTLPVTGLGNGVYVAVDSHQEDAIEYANQFCRRNGKHLAFAVDDVHSVSYKPTINIEKSDNSSQNSSDTRESLNRPSVSVGGELCI